MASSGQFGTSNGNIVYWIEAIQNSQNYGNNTSNVTIRVWIKRTNSGYTTYGNGTVYVTINGSNYTSSLTPSDKITSTSKKIFERTMNISHNSNGEKNLPISARISHAVFSTSTNSWTYGLSDIPRTSKPSLSASSVNYGSAVTINTNRASSSFTHTLRYAWNGRTGTIATGVGASHSWIVPTSFMNYITDRTSTWGTIYCDTYSGGSKIGTESISLTTKIPTNIVPSFSTVTHSENVSNVASKVGSYVQSLSKLNLAITGASGTYGSTIKSYEITFDGVKYNGSSIVSNLIKGSGTLTITGKITDSRGRTASKSVTVSVLAYSAPKITTFKVERANSDGSLNDMGTSAKVTRIGTWSSLNSKNSVSVVIKSKLRGTTAWTTKNTISAGASGSYNASVVLSTYDVAKSHDFRVEFIDQFNTTIALVVMATGEVTMSWGPNGIGVGKIWESGALDIAGDVNVNGQTLRMNNGIGYLNGKPIFTSNNRVLWTGGSWPNGATTIVPDKRISDCANGWIFAWSDFDAPTNTRNDFHFVYTFVSKEHISQGWAGQGEYHIIPVSETLVEHKYLYIWDDRIVGHETNRYMLGQTSGTSNSDAVLRAIIEW